MSIPAARETAGTYGVLVRQDPLRAHESLESAAALLAESVCEVPDHDFLLAGRRQYIGGGWEGRGDVVILTLALAFELADRPTLEVFGGCTERGFEALA